jgi:hypothetical protein
VNKSSVVCRSWAGRYLGQIGFAGIRSRDPPASVMYMIRAFNRVMLIRGMGCQRGDASIGNVPCTKSPLEAINSVFLTRKLATNGRKNTLRIWLYGRKNL